MMISSLTIARRRACGAAPAKFNFMPRFGVDRVCNGPNKLHFRVVSY